MHVAKAPNLSYLDIQGVKVTEEGARLLKNTIRSQQKAGKMQKAFAMVLPKVCGLYENSMRALDDLHHPAFLLVPESQTTGGKRNIVICGSLNKSHSLRNILSAFHALEKQITHI